MTHETRRLACAECGARLDPEAEACDLCGAPAASSPDVPAPAGPARPEPDPEGTAPGGVFCNQCGWQNPAGARFCSMCGAPLQAAAGAPRGARPLPVTADLPGPGAQARAQATPPPADADGARPIGRQVGIVVGLGVLLVVALFLVTALSKDVPSVTAPPPTAVGAADGMAAAGTLDASAPIAPEFAENVDALQAEIANATGEARLAKQRELINLFIGIGRLDRAALLQEEVARAENTAEAWTRTGNLFYDWADSIPEQDAAARVAPARRAVAAYEQVLAQEPGNLDVRTDMAWIAQYDPERPMAAVTQTNQVLAEDPNHVAANFNKGLLFLRINRLDQALAQFEKVQSLVDPSSPVYGQAEAAAQVVRERMGGGS